MRKLLFCGFLLLLLPVVGFSASFKNLTIVKIVLKGNINTDSTLIKAQLSSRVGLRYSLSTISKDVKDLYFLGYFSDIKVDARRLAGGVVLTYLFVEYEKVEKVVIKGNDALDDDDIKELMNIKKGSVYSSVLLRRNIEKIIAKYHKEGYIRAKVVPKVSLDKKTRKATILLTVDEGKKIVIEKMTVVGAKQLDPDSVKDAIEDTHESSFFRSGIYDKANFEKDKARIVKYYHDRGFIDMKISKIDMQIRRIKPNKPKKAIFLYIHVKEGKRFRVGDFSFTGNEVFKTSYILDKMFRLKRGAYFNESLFRRDLAFLWKGYRDKGYIFAHVAPVRKVDRKKMVVNVSYKIFESDKAHIESIKIKGATRTKLYVIKREIRVKEGQVFNSSRIQRSQERLFNLRFFKDVNIGVEPGSAEGLMNLVFSVKEDRTGLFTLGAGYGSVSGFTFYEQISENNFLGMGLRIHERVEYGSKRQSVQIGIDTPYFFKYNPTSAGFSISYYNLRVENIDTNYAAPSSITAGDPDDFYFKRRSFEIQLRGGRAISEYWKAYASYTWAWIDSYDANFEVLSETDPAYANKTDDQKESIGDLREALETGFITKSSLRLGLVYDSRDYVGGPSKGIYFSQFFTYTGGYIGGDSNYILSDSSFHFFVPLMWNFVFAVNTRFSFLFDQFSGETKIYPGDKLQFDGMTELRGWRDYNEDGRGKVSAMIEIRYPIDRRMLWGVLFYDMGKLWSDYKKVAFDLKDYKHSFGFGFRLQIAVLPIRLYFAKKFYYDSNRQLTWVGGSGAFDGWETVFSVAGVF